MRIDRAVVLAPAEPEGGPMASRLPSYLHPVSGRPLIWHTIAAVLSREPPPTSTVVLTQPEFPTELLDNLPPSVELQIFDPVVPPELSGLARSDRVLVTHGGASLAPESLRRLAEAQPGSWIGETETHAAAALVSPEQLERILKAPEPFVVPNGLLAPLNRLADAGDSYMVRTREDLARVQRRIRDHLVRGLMEGGASFLLPDTVIVDVDVRIGRDSVIYPGVILEGQTTIGEETVIGPGCRIIDSWIGSGVELKGWNYVAHTSVRNRAILEPYVRRGFD